MNDSDRAARDLADQYWEDLLSLEPLVATMVGDERFDDLLPDPSEEGRARRSDVHHGALDSISRLDPAELDSDSRTTLALMQSIARRELSELEHRVDCLGAVSHLWGPSQLLAEVASLQRADTPERVERYVRRLEGIPGYLEQIEAVAEDGVRIGVISPGLVVDRTIAQVERLLEAGPESSPPMQLVPPEDARGRDRVAATLRERVWPAYGRYLGALKRYRPSATETIGLFALPGGEAIYRSRILSYATLPLEPQAVHRTGLAEMERIQEQRRAIATSLGYLDPDTAIREHTASGRNIASSREEMLTLARRQVERSWDAAPRWFGRLPNQNCEVRPVEEFREKDMPGAYYQSPTADNSRPGVYYINTSDLESRPLHQVASTTFHEANPGHHFQISIEQEYVDRPAVRRFGGLWAGSAFIEGWGLYSERLADEMGLFENEYEVLGMLDSDAWRAARLVVDTGIHELGWDRERAVRKLQEAGVSRGDAEVEVDRYVAIPGQALAYKIGQLEIARWRAAAETALGAAFSLRDFHDRLMSLGSLPLSVLEGEMSGGAA